MVRAGGASISAARCLFPRRSHTAPKMIAQSPAMINTIKPMLHGSIRSDCHTAMREQLAIGWEGLGIERASDKYARRRLGGAPDPRGDRARRVRQPSWARNADQGPEWSRG